MAKSSEHQKKVLMIFKPLLQERLIPSTMLIQLMQIIPIEEISEIARIEKSPENGRRLAVDRLLDRLFTASESHPDWFQIFMGGLRQSENGHLKDYIEGTSLDNMDDLDSFKRLIEIFAQPLEEITPSEILQYLNSLNDHDKEQILVDERNHGARYAVITLLDRVVKKGGEWFKEFVRALSRIGRQNLADLLDPNIQEGISKTASSNVGSNTSVDSESTVQITEDNGASAVANTKKDNSNDDVEGSRLTAHRENDTLQAESAPNIPNVTENQTDPLFTNTGSNAEAPNEEKSNEAEEKYDHEYSEKVGHPLAAASINDDSKSNALVLHEYQKELVAPALEISEVNHQDIDICKNVIICAPTGSGKTITAIEIMKRHLEKVVTGQRKNRIVFLVNQRPLVDQQERAFKKYLEVEPLNAKIIQLTGETTHISLNEVVEHGYDVIVLTAQVLENALKDNVIRSLSVFTMLIFDECHHTQKKEVFNMIMGRYCDMKVEKPEAPRPQVIGLTASLGVGKATSDSTAENHILQMCANLDAEVLSIVVENKNELMKYAPVVDEDSINVAGRVKDVYGGMITELMSTIETIMFESQGAKELGPSVLKPPNERGSQAYANWVNILSGKSVVIQAQNTRRLFKTCTDHLREYNNSLVIYKDIRGRDAFLYLNKYFNGLYLEGFDELDHRLYDLFQGNKVLLEEIANDLDDRNPVLEMLGSILLSSFKEKPHSRAMILTKTRVSCEALARWITETDEQRDLKLKPGMLIGSHSSSTVDGMPQPEQIATIEHFEKGFYRILVCTSVGQEGIDIKNCNLVLRYNYSTNVIARVQAKGRNRATDGRAFLLARQDTGIAYREGLNVLRESLMSKAVRAVRNMPKPEYRVAVTKIQVNDYEERQLLIRAEEATLRIRSRETPKNPIRFLCGKCFTFACYSTDFRCLHGNHYVNTSEEFLDRIKTLPHDRPIQIDDLFHKTGKVHCKKCMYDWGIIGKRMDSYYPILKIRSFVLERSGGHRDKPYRRWKDAPFTVEPFIDSNKL
ncbi:ATP-dependent RNA helicase DHX58-like isoform X2 [Glandiceps talaboti]